MHYRDKVINELQFQLNSKEVKEQHYPVQLSVSDAENILALLKEQEPVKPEFDSLDGNVGRWRCGSCQVKPDCEHAEHDGIGCLGYAACWQDDEPIDACKTCREYTSNRSGEV